MGRQRKENKVQKIIFAAHCLLNTAAKVVLYEKEDMAAEETLRRRFLSKAVNCGIQPVSYTHLSAIRGFSVRRLSGKSFPERADTEKGMARACEALAVPFPNWNRRLRRAQASCPPHTALSKIFSTSFLS